MRQTTSGETPKIKIYGSKSVKEFIEDSKEKFESDDLTKSCVYDNLKQTNDRIINFLNTFESGEEYSPKGQIKQILKKEFDDCESIYPYLGNAFLYLFFERKILESKSIKVFSKNTYKNFIKSIPEENARNIVNFIISESSPDRQIEVQSSYISEIEMIFRDQTFFKLDFDVDFLGNKKEVTLKNYRFAIIDGYIESVGEIHHLLHYAAKNKEPYVIFCFGISEEVKRVIIENNTKGITQIIPVNLVFGEETVNILNDIALVHDSDVISSLKGQTISQEMRKELSVGKEITINRQGFSVEPIVKEDIVRDHIKYLQKRINEADPETNVNVIKNRIKNIKSKSVVIHVNKDLANNFSFNRSLDYGLRMIKNSDQPYYHVSLENKKILIPISIYNFLNKKVNTVKEMIYNIDKSVIIYT